MRSLLELVWTTLIFLLPSYVANATPVLISKFVKKLHPMDFGIKLPDGNRILGEGKTLEGFFAGIISGSLVGLMINYPNLKPSLILALGAMVGDVLGSFVKRRLGLKRGSPLPPLDQLDFLAGSLILYHYLVAPLSLSRLITAVLITPPLHAITNLIAYLLKLKEVPW